MTCDVWHLTHDGGFKFFQSVSSPACTVWDRQCLEDSEWKDNWMNDWINQLMLKLFMRRRKNDYTVSFNIFTYMTKAIILFDYPCGTSGNQQKLSVNCHLSPMPTATAIYPPPVNSPNVQRRLICQDRNVILGKPVYLPKRLQNIQIQNKVSFKFYQYTLWPEVISPYGFGSHKGGQTDR